MVSLRWFVNCNPLHFGCLCVCAVLATFACFVSFDHRFLSVWPWCPPATASFVPCSLHLWPVLLPSTINSPVVNNQPLIPLCVALWQMSMFCRETKRERKREREIFYGIMSLLWIQVHVSLPLPLFRACCAPVWHKVTLPTTKPTTLFQYDINNKPTPHAATETQRCVWKAKAKQGKAGWAFYIFNWRCWHFLPTMMMKVKSESSHVCVTAVLLVVLRSNTS